MTRLKVENILHNYDNVCRSRLSPEILMWIDNFSILVGDIIFFFQ